MRNDDAIAPIVAVMLILVVIVTLISVYNATYLPGMKQSAEIQHLHDVEEGILKFGSDIELAASLKQNISLSQQIPLGGGDILLNSLKSGGSLQVQQEEEPYLTIDIDGESYPLYLVNISYWTVNNFWVDQAYTWQYGYVNVSRTSGSRLIDSTPLQHTTMDKVRDVLNSSAFGDTLIEIDHDKNNPGNFTIEGVNFTVGNDSFSSGNGVGKLELEARTDKDGREFSNVTVTFTINPDTCLEHNLQGQIQTSPLVDVNVTLILTNITVSAY